MLLDAFTAAYIECALWASRDDNDDPLDDSYDVDDIAPEALTRIVEVCKDFQTAQADSLADCSGSPEQNGHDFFLTRNHHGAGFWDRGYGRIGETLTDAAHAYGSDDWYVGDNGKLYSNG